MKRKLFIILVLAALIAGLWCTSASAAVIGGKCGDDLSYSLNYDTGELVISGTGPMWTFGTLTAVPWYDSADSITSLVIENGVTEISRNAFCRLRNITEVAIPASVTSIGVDAFYECEGLTGVIIPANVTAIGDRAFYGCDNLAEATILNYNCEIGDEVYDVFAGSASGFTLRGYTGSTAETYASNHQHSFGNPKCGNNVTFDFNPATGALTISGTTNMIYGSSESDIPWYDIRNEITSVVIENGVKSISHNAFKDCANLNSITIPDSVTYVGFEAFYGCSSLSSVTIPDSVTQMNNWTFAYCTNLTHVTLPSSLSILYDGFFFNTGFTSITIPASVNEIRYNAFRHCTNLTSAIILNPQTEFTSTFIFEDCSPSFTLYGWTGSTAETYANNNSIPFVALGGSCGDDVAYTFDPTTGTLTISGTGPIAGYSSPSDMPWYSIKDKITSVTIENGVTGIGSCAFPTCDSLTSVNIPDSVTYISGSAFAQCDSLSSMTIPNSVTQIGVSAFLYCDDLTEVTILNPETNIANSAFESCPHLTLYGWTPSTAQTYANDNGIPFASIGGSCGNNLTYAFDPATGTLTISGTGRMALYTTTAQAPWYSYRERIASVVIGDGVTSIGPFAFRGCSSLNNVELPNSVTSIFEEAFSNCYHLSNITIMNPNASIAPRAFSNCSSLTIYGWTGSSAETYAQNNPINEFQQSIPFIPLDGLTGSCGDRVTYSFDPATHTLTISGSGRMTDYYQFYAPWYSYCTTITSVDIKSGVTWIGDYAFADCTNLTSVSIPDSVTNIGISAFEGCRSLSSITIPDGVMSIAGSTFTNCTGLTDMNIPGSVTVIYAYAFEGCSNLASVTINNPETTIANMVFYNCPSLTIHGWPGSTAETYANNNTIPFVSMGSLSGTCGPNVTWDFDPATGTMTISGTGIITNYAPNFSPAYGLRSLLTSAVIEDGVTTIGTYFFCDCAKLSSVSIPNSVEDIRRDAFGRCTSLTSVTIPTSVTYIESHAFEDCTGLTSVTVMNPSCHIGYNSYDVFEGCNRPVLRGWSGSTAETYAGHSESNVTFASLGNLTGSCGANLTYSFNPVTGELTIEGTGPMSYAGVGVPWFNYNTLIKIVDIGDKVTSIGSCAFYGCRNLLNITIPDKVEIIGPAAFRGTSLTSVMIPDSVTQIDYWAFSYCDSLTSAFIGNPDCTIGDADYDVFRDCAANFRLSGMPGSTAEVYAANNKHPCPFDPAGPVPDFFLPDALTTIESEAFRDISALTVVIPKNVQTIASNAFEDSDVMYVYGFPGTAAETWADSNALTFFSLTDAWYARLKAR